ncbi:hypothetical protein [Flavobacterium sp. PL002]|uniref:hypothetical protein n=1 Tax=Flavobacterium sp. PL002 TaxID=1897058 RepID=UPI001787B598|nr:hypothetical protein [Flavobacterium sp. PL002]MBE0392330.1 hypothetical protein [Flavobacterium sp. PL002]
MIPLTHFLHEFYLGPVINKRYNYRFVTTTTDSSNKKRIVEKSIIREVDFTHLGQRDELFVFDVFTARVTLSSNQTIKNERLLKEDIYAFDDIEMGVNDKGEISKVYNIKEMQYRWKSKMIELRVDNSGYELEAFFDEISDVMNDTEKLLFYLNSKNMFGLYFHGLFGKNDMHVVPKKRTAAILDLDDVLVTEEIWTDNREPSFVIRAQKTNDIHKNIESSSDVLKKYEGELRYNQDHQMVEGFLEIENENLNIKHNVLWVG